MSPAGSVNERCFTREENSLGLVSVLTGHLSLRYVQRPISTTRGVCKTASTEYHRVGGAFTAFSSLPGQHSDHYSQKLRFAFLERRIINWRFI